MATILRQEITPLGEGFEITSHYSDGTRVTRPAEGSELEKCRARMQEINNSFEYSGGPLLTRGGNPVKKD